MLKIVKSQLFLGITSALFYIFLIPLIIINYSFIDWNIYTTAIHSSISCKSRIIFPYFLR